MFTNIVRDRAGYLVTESDLLKDSRPPECWTLERDPFFLETSVPGSSAAGDVQPSGAMAVTFAHKYLEETA